MQKPAKKFVLAAALFAALPLAAPAVAQMTSETVSFPRGSTGTTVSGRLTGNEIRDYVVNAGEGQLLSVEKTGSDIIYFNVMPPGSNGEAVFVGSTSGDNYSGRLSESGNWIIRVYQMRATARRGERGRYNLAISVTGRGGGAANRPSNVRRPPSAKRNMGSIAGIEGMSGVDAFDRLQERGFVNVDSFSSGDTLYGIYYYRPSRLCVQTTSADGRIVDIRDIKNHPKCR